MVYKEIYDIFMYPVLHSHLVENLEIRKERYWIHKDEILDALREANELLVLVTPWALTRSYVWLEIGAAWLRGIPIVVVLLGVTPAEFRERANIPIALKERNLIALNQIDKYFSELQVRANGALA